MPRATLAWHFAQPAKNQKQRESEAERFFMSDAGTDLAEDLVREGLQNALDAHLDGQPPVEVVIRLGHMEDAVAARYAEGLIPHVAVLKKALPGTESVCGGGSYLAFEDFNTRGLTGDERQQRRYDEDPPNAFHTFFRAEGRTDKLPGKLGSHGVGKIALMAASRAHTIICLTTRYDDRRTFLFGTGVFRSHMFGDKDFECDAWFGRHEDDLFLPSEDSSDIDQFRKDFDLSRAEQAGLSVIVPWLDQDDENGVTKERLVNAVLRGHIYPILRGDLVVHVRDSGANVLINASTLVALVSSIQDDKLRRELQPAAELIQWALSHPPQVQLGEHGKHGPSWSNPGLMSPEQQNLLRQLFETGEAFSVRVPLTLRPKLVAPAKSFFDVFMRREDSTIGHSQTVLYLRQDLLIAGMSRNVAGIRAVVMVNQEHAAEFVRKAENPSHTRVDAKGLNKKYSYAAQTLNFILSSPAGIAKLLTGESGDKDKLILADDLSLPEGDAHGTGSGGPKTPGPGKEPKPKPKPIAKRPYDVRVSGGDVVVRPSDKPFPYLPAYLELALAYHVRGHDPLTRWVPDDFNLSPRKSGAIRFHNVGCSIIRRRDNTLALRIDNSTFEFRISGFDTRRELFCKPRLSSSENVALVDALGVADEA